MAKGNNAPKGTDVAVQDAGGTAVATAGLFGGMTQAEIDELKRDAGQGVSTAAEDSIVPMVVVLQALSPQVDRRSADYVEDAEPGAIWLRGAEPPVVSGEEGFPFVHCVFRHQWVEWTPRKSGGGFVTVHDTQPEEAAWQEVQGDNGPRKVLRMPNGNDIVETRYHIGLYPSAGGALLPYIIPFSSSGHAASKQWTGLMKAAQIPGTNLIAPGYAFVYRLRTRQRTKNNYTWFTFEISRERPTTANEREAARALIQSFEAGDKRADYAESAAAAPAAGEDLPF
jgi:hypothetical protein